MKTTETFLAGVLIASFAMSAKAIPIHFEDTYDPEETVDLVSNKQVFTYSHRLTDFGTPNDLNAWIDGVLAPGEEYDSTTDTLSSGTIELWFTGLDRNWDSGSFTVQLASLDPLARQFAGIVDVGGIAFDVSVISAAGELDVVITRTNAAGSVRFDKSVLNVLGDRASVSTPPGTVAVPEPGTVALLGIGLLGIGFSRSRRTA